MPETVHAGPRLEIVLGAHVLDWWGGSVTYTMTVARELARLGHGVTTFSPRFGDPGRVARGWGLDVVDRETALPETCGVVFAQDAWSAYALGARYPERLRIDRQRAIWIEGAPHLFFYRPPDSEFADAELRLAENVLLLERGNLLVRLEGAFSRERALELARSLR